MDFTVDIENRTESHLFPNLSSAEHYIRIVNGAPGLRRMAFKVNGVLFAQFEMRNNETRVLDIGPAMQEGSDNQVLLEAIGPRGASAYTLVGDDSVK